ncbi:uncharacterized protein M421DRAFT_252122 [Didymella exigua CBS 183.55]|uniref:Zn(2)-C6 fungal-type domain-containing protein n=1 Tax=Didymella exigua CBS 183.55 TaxID=1150837 RepID=A0A6A5RWM5_9PLEO|nr:uncharacterized protein M421DRAFT_252122 [Didymella exigua CBS 183.55]KAF1932905.1 hypothetical protein M421DRAFT_252122 [Didymella exigua CBS 183.55]
MAQSSAGTAAPFSLRVVQRTLGKSLIVALPLPSSAIILRQSSPLSSPTVAANLPTLSRAFWKRLSYSPAHLTIGTVLRRLGLRQVPNSKRIVFQYNQVVRLADAVAEVLRKLPTALEELIEAAAEFKPTALDEDIAHLLYRFGNDIWGAKNERPWLLQASEGVVEYQKDLVFGDVADQEVMVYYLRLWIFVKAFNAMRKTAQPRAKNTAPANLDEQTRRTSTRRTGGSSLLTQDLQPLTPGSSLSATADHVATSTGSNAAPVPAPDSKNLHFDSTIQMRRTARTSEPHKDFVYIDGDSKESVDELSELEEESDDETPRHYKGKGRAWKKTEADEDPAFLSKGARRSSKRSTSDIQSQVTGRPRGRPPKRLGKETLSAPARHSVSAQEMSGQKESQRPRRKYRSEGVVNNSSDGSEDRSNISTKATKTAVGNGINSQSRQQPGGKSARQPPGACESCRRRRQKCDRARPECGRCILLGFICRYIPNPTSATPVKSTPRPRAEEMEAEVHIESKHGPSDRLTTNGNMQLQKVDLPLDADWDEGRWRYFHLRSSRDHTMLATMRSLGLKVMPKNRAATRFVVESYVSLCKAICQIAGKLCDNLSAAELIAFAADPSYLDEEIDILFDDYSFIWSVDADRTKLLTAGSDLLYPTDLSYEDDDDRKLLWIHLHRWTFIVALEKCKEVHGAGVHNMRKVIDTEIPTNTDNQWQLEGTYTFESPEDSVAFQFESNVSTPTNDQPLEPAPESAGDMFSDLTLRDHETRLLKAVGNLFADVKSGQQDNGTATITRRPSKRQQKRKDSSIATPEQPDATRPNKQRRVGRTLTKPDDFTALFMSYLSNFADPEFDELAGLASIEKELPIVKDYASGLDTKQRARLSSTVLAVTLPAWLAYRSVIVESKRKIAAMPPLAEAPSRQVAIMERNRLATLLRKTHKTFVKAGHDDLRPEQVIYHALMMLMNEHGNSQIAEDIRGGFKRMEDEFTSLGDQLMKDGGAKYVMGGAASVAVLKEMQPHARAGR